LLRILFFGEMPLDKPGGTLYNILAYDGQFVTILSLNKTTGNIVSRRGAPFLLPERELSKFYVQ